MSEAQRDEIDGVPVFWGSAPPPLTALLTFRVGQADESLAGRGITHLVEHLALAGLGQQRYAYNGSVDGLLTNFIVSGTDSDVVSFLNSTARSLAQLPLDRLPIESTILKTEEARRSNGAPGTLLTLRYGTQGFGLPALPEFYLNGAVAETVDRWRAEWFTAQNATLWLNGPPPPGIDLSPLGAGSRRPPPAPIPLDQPLPGWYPVRGNLIAVTMLSRRSSAMHLAGETFTRRLRKRLRETDGLSYEVSGSYEPLGPGYAHSSVQADALAQHADSVRDAMVTELSRYRLLGPTQSEVDEVREDHRRRREDSPHRAALAARHLAVEWLLVAGGDVEALEAEIDAWSIDDLQRAMDDALKSAIWLVPGEAGMPDHRVVRILDHSVTGVDGTEHLPAPGTLGDEAQHRLVVGDDGLTLWIRPDTPITVRFRECPAMQVWDDDARTLWGPDALRVFVHSRAWQHGDQAVVAIDQRVDPDVHVHMHESSGYSPPSSQASPEPPPRKRRLRRAR